MLNTRTPNTNQSVTFNLALRHEHNTIKFARPYWVPPTHNELLDRGFPQADSFLSCEVQFDGRSHQCPPT